MKSCFTVSVGLFGMEAQDGHLDFHTAPELWHTAAIPRDICFSTDASYKRLSSATAWAFCLARLWKLPWLYTDHAPSACPRGNYTMQSSVRPLTKGTC